jgi:hypothetical protein
VIRTEVRFDVKLISADALAGYMKFRGETVRSLAAKVGCDFRTIGHLRSGKRTTCNRDIAPLIEKHLNAPPGSLFVPRVSRVQRETARSAA